MKARFILITSALLAACAVHAAEGVDPNQLPAPVRQALDEAAVNEAIKEVTTRSVDGRTVYDVELERKRAPNARLRVSADGAILHDSRRPAVDAGSSYPSMAVYPEFGIPPDTLRLTLEDLPDAAQQTINKHAAGREIAEISPDTINERPGYRVTFRERGRNPRLYVADDGTLLRPMEKPPVLGFGTTFADAPAMVQETIRREADDGVIVNIEKEGLRGVATTYKVDLRNNQGEFQLQIGENGTILKDSRKGSGR